MDNKFVPNPKRFRECREPFTNADAANAAVEAFYQEFSELRVKHKIASAYVIIRGMFLNDDGSEVSFGSSGGVGHGLEWLPMIARAMGQEESNNRQWLNKLRTGEMK